MQNFSWSLPTRFVFGKGVADQVGKECAREGSRALLVYGGQSALRSGLIARVEQSLAAAGVSHLSYGGIQPNPRLGPVNECIALCRKETVDVILAVGGGSVVDTAKAIAAGVCYGGDAWDFFCGKASVARALPVGSVITIPAAGSESSTNMVISTEDGVTKRGAGSRALIPRFAILDPELTYTLPAFQTACGACDMMIHVLERYFTNEPDVLVTDYLCEAVLKTVIESAPIAIAHPTDYAARAQIMWAGAIAHNDVCGVGRVGDWATHGIEHELSARYGVAHGAGLAVVSPAWMRYVYKHDVPRFARFAHNVWNIAPTGDREADALSGIAATEAFFQSIGLPTRFGPLGAKEEDIPYLAGHTVRPNGKTTGYFVPLTAQDVENILRLAL